MPQLNFDMTNVEPAGNFEPLPEGDYNVVVEDSELRQSKAGHNMINITLRVLGPTHANRKVYVNYNIEHPKEDVRRIAHGELKALANACGYENIQSTEQIHGRQLVIYTKPEGDYDRVKSYKQNTGQATVPSPTAQPAAPAPAPAPQPATQPAQAAPLPQAAPAPAPWQQNQG